MCSLAIWPAMQPSIMSYKIDISTRPRHFITAPCHKPQAILSLSHSKDEFLLLLGYWSWSLGWWFPSCTDAKISRIWSTSVCKESQKTKQTSLLSDATYHIFSHSSIFIKSHSLQLAHKLNMSFSAEPYQIYTLFYFWPHNKIQFSISIMPISPCPFM